MNSSTSNAQRFRTTESHNVIESTRREAVSNSTLRESRQAASHVTSNEQTVYRSSFPDHVGFDELVSRKEVLLDLMKEFKDKEGRVVFEPEKQEEYSKRLFLLEQEINGLMRQSYMYSERGTDGAVRTIDYLSLIN
jgi:hypothetical protein